MTKGRKRGLLIYVAILVILGGITELAPKVTGALTQTEILQYENMQITDQVSCYFIRNETVYTAPGSGQINYYIEDGIKVRKNTKVLDISPQAASEEESEYSEIISRLGSSGAALQQMNSAKTGIVCYYVDGYEGFFTPETMENLRYKDVENLKIEPVNLTRKTTLAGEPLFKISEGNYWYMLCWVDPGNISNYEVGNSVTVSLPLGQIKADIEKIVDQGDKWLVIMKTTHYYEDFAKLRTSEALITTKEYSGIKVRNSSITTEDGVVGVYIKSKNGDFVFKPVKIFLSDGNYSLVYVSTFYNQEGNAVDTVKIYDEILKNPSQELSKQQDSEGGGDKGKEGGKSGSAGLKDKKEE